MTDYPKGFYEFQVIHPALDECIDTIRLPIAALPELIRDMQDVVGEAIGGFDNDSITLPVTESLNLKSFLLNHGDEIANGENDFSELLTCVFESVFERSVKDWFDEQKMEGTEKKKPKFTGASPIKDLANAMAEMTNELRELLDKMKAGPKDKEEAEKPAIYVATRYNYGTENIERIMVNDSQIEAKEQTEEWMMVASGVWTCMEYNYWKCEEKQTVIRITKVELEK